MFLFKRFLYCAIAQKEIFMAKAKVVCKGVKITTRNRKIAKRLSRVYKTPIVVFYHNGVHLRTLDKMTHSDLCVSTVLYWSYIECEKVDCRNRGWTPSITANLTKVRKTTV